MVAARSRVLATGAFRPISDAIATQTIALLKLAGKRSCAVLDAGCGEGSYLHALASALAAHPELEARLAGIDISKWAIQSATKRAATATFLAVASNRHLPFRKEKLDVIVSLFGFPLWDAFAPTQPPCAHVLLVDPAPDHLKELRTIIYRNVRKTQPPRLDAALASGYRQADEQRITFSFDLEPATLIADLLTMTPHAHRATAEGRATLATKTRLALTGDVVMRTLVKSAA
jgi:23S rRNA (guanine745-N1)-methyltransferase